MGVANIQKGATPFYVYILFREDGSPCYVGKGKGTRLRVHSRKSHNPDLNQIIESLNGVRLPSEIIGQSLSEKEAFDLEIATIARLGRAPNGPLLNRTDGGEGLSGVVQSAQTKELHRLTLLGVPKSRISRERMKAAWTPERKLLMREMAKQQYARMNPEEKQQRSLRIKSATIEAMGDAVIRAKISSALSGRKHDAIRRVLTSQSIRRALLENPEFRENLRKSRVGKKPMLGKSHSLETRAKMSESHKRRGACKGIL